MNMMNPPPPAPDTLPLMAPASRVMPKISCEEIAKAVEFLASAAYAQFVKMGSFCKIAAHSKGAGSARGAPCGLLHYTGMMIPQCGRDGTSWRISSLAAGA